MKISMLHYSNSIIDFDRLFGMQVSEINTLNQLLSRGVDAKLYARKIVGCHEHIHELEYVEYNKILHDIPFYTKFIETCHDSEILQGNATPLLACLIPEKTIIRVNGHFDFPLASKKEIAERYRRAHYLFVSNYMRETYMKKYAFLKSENCYVLHNAVDLRHQKPRNNSKVIKMIYASRWITQKGLHIVLDLLKRLQKSHDDYEIYIAGGLHTTGKNDESKRQTETRIIQEFRKLKNVHVLGYLKPSQLLDQLDDIDLLLFPSIWGEPFSSLPLQAAMAGVPTICFKDGSLGEAIKNNTTGMLVTKSRFHAINVRRYHSCIDMLLRNREKIYEMGSEARKFVIKNFSWDNHIRKLVDIYKNIIE